MSDTAIEKAIAIDQRTSIRCRVAGFSPLTLGHETNTLPFNPSSFFSPQRARHLFQVPLFLHSPRRQSSNRRPAPRRQRQQKVRRGRREARFELEGFGRFHHRF